MFPGKSEFTKKKWAKAKALPFVPFDAERAEWRPDVLVEKRGRFQGWIC